LSVFFVQRHFNTDCIPSTEFVLQQNLDLAAPNWVTLANSPVLNLSNLQQQVTLSSTNSKAFYRLAAP